ncbi:MAG: hemerythrin domain-containing protein [Candidatus Paceibacterota bacterium]|jgi:hemerythrin superfamily protein|nr:hemerythrin domain-containing protein [Candidatus Paceibacterota bacterium]
MPEDQNSVLSLMVNHHALLEMLFFIAKDDAISKSDRAKETISAFRWEYEKHMFAEENVIFNFLQWNYPDVYQLTLRLTNEHESIRHLLDKIESELPNVSENDLTVLSSLLSGHRKDEETNLYPMVDKELPENQRKRIIERINGVAPINNFVK